MARKRDPNQRNIFDDWFIDDATKSIGESKDNFVPLNDSVLPGVEKTFENQRHALSLQLAEKLDKDGVITSKFLTDEANRAFGGTQAEGVYSSKDAYDAMEAAFNIHLSRTENEDWNNQDGVWAKDKAAELTRRIQNLPTQTRRDEEMDEYQQFSTPPALSFVANWVASVESTDVMMDPSGGTGDLAIWANISGAEVILNELSPRRLTLLADLFPQAKVFKENAEQLDNVLPFDVIPSVIVMNPPFSSTAGRVQGQRDTGNGARHIEQALKRLETGGRMVAIVGNGMAMDKPAFTGWWSDIKKKYNVRANIGISGKEYAKYGTTFDNQLLVIDKNGSTTLPVLTGRVESVADLPLLLEGIRNERKQIQRGIDKPAINEDPQSIRDTLQPRNGLGSSGAGTGSTGTESLGNGADPGTPIVDSQTSGESRTRNVTHDGIRAGGGISDGLSGNATGSSGADPRGNSRVIAGGESGTITIETKKGETTEFSDSVFSDYTPQRLTIAGAQQHPGKLVQSAAMSAVEPPAPNYSPVLPNNLIQEGLLSIAQLEAVVYAGQAHSEKLPNGSRKGFFIGDGTGVGKGREISGIILDNMLQGRNKAVWVSFNEGLIEDAKRDFAGIGGDPGKIFFQGKTKAGGEITQTDGILFTTYSTLRGGQKKQANDLGQTAGKTRAQQIVDWLGKDFDGVIAFDEAHSMGNAIAVKGKRGIQKPSQQAIAGINLQKELSDARIAYVSATGATEISNLSYADRLGLWGEGTPFADVGAFIGDVSHGGIASMELISRDMKALGMSISRNLSYDGVTYERLEHKLSEFQEDVYNELAGAWQVVLNNVDQALAITQAGKNGNAKSAAMAQFWGAHQRFFNQVITAMQTPCVIDDIRKQIDAGNCAVIQLVNTNEAAQERIIAEAAANDAALEDLDFTPRQMLVDYVKNGFPVAAFEESQDANGNKVYVAVRDSEGNQVFDREAVALRDSLLETLHQIRVPENPLDSIINAFGTDMVAEVTGRSRRFVQTRDDGGNMKVVEEKRGKTSSRFDAAAFQNNKKSILIFSGAGGTGYSFHADNTAENQRKRVHYILQPGWQADKAVQGFGRTHRTNQAVEPHYVLPTTNLKAQKRFVSSIARRLDQLGALTRGQREATSQGMFTASDNLESGYASSALKTFFTDLYQGKTDLSFQDVAKQMGLNLLDENASLSESKIPDIPQFLNRLLSLKTDMQNVVFGEFEKRLIETVEYAKQHGLYDVGLQTMTALSIQKTRDAVVYEDKKTRAQTRYVELAVTNEIKYTTWEDAKKIAANQRRTDDLSGWFVSEHGKNKGDVFFLADIGKRINFDGESVHRGVIHTIREHNHKYIDNADDMNRGYDYQNIPKNGRSSYEKVTLTRAIEETEAKKLWEEQIAIAPTTETKTKRMIVGVILPIWDRVEGSETINRLQTDDGEQLLGRMLGLQAAKKTLKNLGVGSDLSHMTASDLFQSIKNGNKAILANGWEIATAKVNFEDRIEVKGRNYLTDAEKRNLKEQGAFIERISWAERVFIPTGEGGVEIFERITTSKPVVDLIEKNPQIKVQEEEQEYGMPLQQVESDSIPIKGEAQKMGNTFRVVISKTNEQQTFLDAKEAGAAFFAADRTLNPTVIHESDGAKARFMAVTEIHGTYPNGEQRFVKSLPDSHEVDPDFRIGYMEALESSIIEQLKATDWIKAKSDQPDRAPVLDAKLYDDLQTISQSDQAKAIALWADHVPTGISAPVFSALGLENAHIDVAVGDEKISVRGNSESVTKRPATEGKSKNKMPFHQQVAEKLIEQLEKGVAPWQRPWLPGEPGGMMPLNPTTGKRYKGINAVYLVSQGYNDQRWMTYKQAEAVEAQVRKGEKGTPIQYWKFTEEHTVTDANGKPRVNDDGESIKESVKLERPRVFFATVFNAEQIDGLPPLQPRPQQEWDALERAEKILQASGAQILHNEQNKAFYRPGTDSIHLPNKGQFSSANNYYATALHELGHWTGHTSRLDRDLANPFGSEGYAKEELRAEISSMIVGSELGIGHDPGQHVAYVGSWVKALKEDHLEIFRAAADAEKIKNYVFDLERVQDLTAEQRQALIEEANMERSPVSMAAEVIEHRQQESQTLSQADLEATKKTLLEVPFKEKEEAKALGAKWDRQEQSWYVPVNVDPTPFSKWMQEGKTTGAVKEVSERQYLAVPYGERVAAKAAGALWDKAAKSWYAGPKADVARLERWAVDKFPVQGPAITPQEEFAEALKVMGCVVDGQHPIMDGAKHRITVENDKKGEQAGFYVGHLDGHPAGYIKNNRTGVDMKWKSKGYVLDPEQKAQLQAEASAKLQAREAAQLKLHEQVAQRVSRQMDGLVSVVQPTPYMQAKGVQPQVGVLTDKEGLKTYIPAFDVTGKQWTMQYIQEDGTKRFAKDSRKEGCFHVVGGLEALEKAPAVVVSEGYATASSLSQSLGFATVAAFDSGNLPHVASALHAKFPEKPFIIAGDNDLFLELVDGVNPGRSKAEEAARAVGGKALFPIFAPGEQSYPASLAPVVPGQFREGKLSDDQSSALLKIKLYTDFNDLAHKSVLGKDGVDRQVSVIVKDVVEKHHAQIVQHKQESVKQGRGVKMR